MGSKEFLNAAFGAILTYVNDNLDKSDGMKLDANDIYVVWMCKTLQNCKGLFSTKLPDGMYYEVTYNGDAEEMYLDAYKKWENVVVVKATSEN